MTQQGLELEFMADNNLAGFRLQRLEIFNWGTFHHKVWKVEVNGKNGLLTGDIGSGKSTVVDAMTTLLVPAHRIAYNKAAGAESKERDLRSYVLGYYKSERDETGKIKPAQLRNNQSYSVILGVFYNEGYDQYITLAQVFWITEQRTQPERLYVGAERALSIAEDFANFGTQMSTLSKKLTQSGCEVFKTFPPYGAWFRRRFGIQNEQALELFHQTVSMKSVGNLTDFVRNHMLEPFEETKQRINDLLTHFDDLNRAYHAVLKAENQVRLLTPIVEDCAAYQNLAEEIAKINQYIEALTPYFSKKKIGLLQLLLAELNAQWKVTLEKIQQLEQLKQQQTDEIDQVKWDIQQNGGNRLSELKREISEKTQIKNTRKAKFQQYQDYIQQLDEIVVNNTEDFIYQKTKLQERKKEIHQQQIEQSNIDIESNMLLRQYTDEIKQLNQEIQSLTQRESNIGHRQIEIRQRLCQSLNLNEEKFPFIGELIQVKETEKDWEGAAERLLHHFALSLIVPDEYYSQVSEWVNNNHLNGRIVYYRIAKNIAMQNECIHPQSLIYKLAIKPHTPYYQWLENELYKRFDYAACESGEQFRREGRAISLKGQIKDKSGRHEKDDRYEINDRRRYVLGWSNKDKISILKQSVKKFELKLSQVQQQIIDSKVLQQKLNKQNELLIRLEAFSSFNELDFDAMVKEITILDQEYQKLSSSSNILQQLNGKLSQLETELKYTDQQLFQLAQVKGGLETRQSHAKNDLELTELFVEEMPISEQLNEAISQQLSIILVKRSLTLENCEETKERLQKKLTDQIKEYNIQLTKYNTLIVKAMTNFNHQYPLETQDFVPDVASFSEYQTFLVHLNNDDLPRFVLQFKQLLNENTINEIANLNAQLYRERETIKQRIGQINRSLETIDYNPERYISLQYDFNTDIEIRQFQQDLKACTEGAVTGSEDNQYSEAKFLQVKAIVDRFKGREHCTEADKRWTTKVTDVRNWFLFSASERWRADHSEHEYYPDSGGKSGGQKEKLAYTILAASLAYQFGLEFGVTKSRSFRFVMIDEAFGRGSDESAQYGLRLFKQLNLQLLIVTPLQKIDVIEPFVSSVTIVKNNQGADSSLVNLTIEEHLARKAVQMKHEAN